MENIKTCQHCKQSFVFEKPQQFGAHVVNCKMNPKLQERLNNLSKSLTGLAKAKRHCDKCNKEMSVSNFDRHYAKCDPNKRQPIKVEESWKTDTGKYQCPHCNLLFLKAGIGAHIFLEHTEEGVEFKETKYKSGMTGKFAWSRGLTKETDIRVKRASEQQKQNFANGTLHIPFEGKKHSKETIEFLSLRQSKFLEEQGNSGFPDVKWYKAKNILGEEFSLRGTWELATAEWLNKMNILWVRKIYLKYLKGEINRTYCPDFYLPEQGVYLEVKGYFSQVDQEKIKLVEQCNNIKINMLFKNKIKNLDKTNSLKDLLL